MDNKPNSLNTVNKESVNVEFVVHNYPTFWDSIYKNIVAARKELERVCDDVEHCDLLQFIHDPGALFEFLESEGEQLDFIKINDEWISLYICSADQRFRGYTYTLHIPSGQMFDVEGDFNHPLHAQFMELVEEEEEEEY